jgi:hypothetical protein
MTDHDPIDVDRLSVDQLAAALQAGMVGSDWPDQAAVDLLVQHRGWLSRFELRQAVEMAVLDGELCAWVVWHEVDMRAPASSGELRILTIVLSLAGVVAERSLADLLSSLDELNTAWVLRAVSIACSGRDMVSCGIGERGEGVS